MQIFPGAIPEGPLVTLVLATQSSFEIGKEAKAAIDGQLSLPNAQTKVQSKPWLKVHFSGMTSIGFVWTVMGAGGDTSARALIEVWVLR